MTKSTANAMSAVTRTGNCLVCEKEFQFVHVGGRYQAFCSPECKATRTREQRIASRTRLDAGERRNKEHRRHKQHRKPPRHEFVCEQCGERYNGVRSGRGNRFCGARCRDVWYQAQRTAAVQDKLKEMACPTCDTTFRQKHPTQKYCCRKCERILMWSNATHIRRARTSSGYVNPFVVFTRDGWTCKICGCDTPRSMRGTLAPNAPELDHVVPPGIGGEHSYENTQCACRACNGAKGMKAA